MRESNQLAERPSVALGSYDATPLDMAGAYTTFANGGVRIDPWFVASVRSASGDVLNDYPPNSKPILDPAGRVSDFGADGERGQLPARARRIRAHGFTAPRPARRAPPTMHGLPALPATCSAWCGWAMTITQTMKLEGAQTAAPIWAEFMKHAVKLPQYSDTRQFPTPSWGFDGAAG